MLTSSSLDAVAYVSESSAFMQATPLALPATARSALPERSFASPDNAALADVLRHPGIWRRGSKPAPTSDAPSTGLAELDARLPGSGWPRGGLTEILIEHDGIGECSLLLPALAALTRARQRVVLIAPPYIPYAPALAEAGIDLSQLVHIEAGVADTHWTAEQCLRAGCCGAVVNWLPKADYRQLRRLQLAAETGAALAFVFRPLAAAQEASPAALRLKITVSAGERRIEILKCRGALGGSQAIGQRA
ncbi:MAG: translesion DNA synthesis-associated protein ImuA [Dokdonella sp.]